MRRLAVVLTALLIVGCGGPPPAPPSVVVGADAESVLLAHLYAAALRYYGSPAYVQDTPDLLGALDSGEIDVAPAFTGAVLTRFAPDAAARSAAQVYRAMVGALPEGLGAGDYADGTSDKPTVALTTDTAHNWQAGDVTDLIGRCAALEPGATEGARVPESFGTCAPRPAREVADAEALWAALRSGKVDMAWTSAAAPDIPEDVTLLSDRTALIRAENVVPVFRRNTLSQMQLRSVNELAGVLDTDALAQMRAAVAGGAEPGMIATAWLDANPIGH